MTFFNKKTEVMQIEMTPYGRYLYSIGKFKPHSYEFVDDDVLYKASGSTEAQEDAHQRILNETPRLKGPKAFQKYSQINQTINTVSDKRELMGRMDQKQNGLFALGRSSYSSDKLPNFHISMLRGEISSSSPTHEVSSSYTENNATVATTSGSIFIPQVKIEYILNATVKNTLDEVPAFDSISSKVFDNGDYVSFTYEDPIIHFKEFNSFYEKENFELEIFEVLQNQELKKMKLTSTTSKIINDMLFEEADVPLGNFNSTALGELQEDYEYEAIEYNPDFFEYYFDIEVDEQIPSLELCKVVDSLEINNQFLDEELICPDRRTDRFNIYATRVGPSDLEDCDD